MKIDEETILNGATMPPTGNEEKTEVILNGDADVNDEEIEVKPAVEDESKNGQWKVISMAGAAGIMLGAAGSAIANNLTTEEINGNSGNNGGGHHGHAGHNAETDLPVAHNVNDAMSFSQAFAAARHEVGAGGVFTWHGNVYGTYYANEWNGMTPEEKNAFSNHAVRQVHAEPYNPKPDPDPDPKPDPDPDPDPKPDPDPDPKPDPDGELHVIAVERHVEGPNGEDLTIGIAEMDGTAAYFIDVDGDEKFDVAVFDDNNNQIPDEGDDVIDIREEGITADQFESMAMKNLAMNDDMDNTLDDMPDYTNDADPSGFA